MRKTILGLLLGVFAVGLAAQDQQTTQQMQKMNQFLRYLTSNYIDTLNTASVVENAIVGILAELDPHSTYVSPEEMKSVNESFNANFEGIGIEFNVFNDTIIVVNTIPGGPSETVGLLPNDRIVTVDGVNVVGMKQYEVPNLLRGPRGTRVEVGVARRGTPEVLNFTILRDKIPIYTVDASYKVDEVTGYVKINRFANTTSQEMAAAIGNMGAIDNLILDLRGNGGGYLDQAIRVVSAFFPRGVLVVTVEGGSRPEEVLETSSVAILRNGRLIVLVDEFSASASEIVAGAIQDWDRGLVIGRRTFGKGLVQRQFNLVDGAAVRITTARYHTPTGRVIQRPYEAGKSDEYYADFNSRFTMDSLPNLPDSLEYRTLRSGRVVYGGGGITPDLIVPRDTTGYTKYWSSLIRNGIVNEFSLDYMDRNRTRLEALYPDFDTFDREFTVTDEMIFDLVALADRRDLPYSEEELEISKERIRTYLKALFAQKLWTPSEYYRIMNRETDEVFRKAVEVLRDWNEYSAGISPM